MKMISLKTRRIKYYKAISNSTGKLILHHYLSRKHTNTLQAINFPTPFLTDIGKNSIHFIFLERNGFSVVLVEEINSMKENIY